MSLRIFTQNIKTCVSKFNSQNESNLVLFSYVFIIYYWRSWEITMPGNWKIKWWLCRYLISIDMETQIWHQHLKTLAGFALASIHFGCHCFIWTCNCTVLLECGELVRQCQGLQDHQDSAWLDPTGPALPGTLWVNSKRAAKRWGVEMT